MKPGDEGGGAVGPGEKVLIVEDEDHWHGIYEEAVEAQGSEPSVRMAKDLLSAERLIDAVKFAVAFVDVSLDPHDGRNADGLKVMKKIRDVGDETSIVVVTGRSGQDVLPITRNAIKDYGAYDTVGKSRVTPKDITKLLEGGLEAYRQATVAGRKDARDALRGGLRPEKWDDEVMRATHFRGDAGSFYDFLRDLLGEFLPLVARDGGGQAVIDPATGLVLGEYWSRAIGAAVLICFGAAEPFDEAADGDDGAAGQFGRYQVGRRIKEVRYSKKQSDSRAVKGAVFLLEKGKREDYAGTRVQ
jgi:ActR/RegA family two-component response regulator